MLAICDQKANSVADIAYVLGKLDIQEGEEVKEGKGEKGTRLGLIGEQTGTEVEIKWKNLLDAEYAETWTDNVEHGTMEWSLNNRNPEKLTGNRKYAAETERLEEEVKEKRKLAYEEYKEAKRIEWEASGPERDAKKKAWLKKQGALEEKVRAIDEEKDAERIARGMSPEYIAQRASPEYVAKRQAWLEKNGLTEERLHAIKADDARRRDAERRALRETPEYMAERKAWLEKHGAINEERRAMKEKKKAEKEAEKIARRNSPEFVARRASPEYVAKRQAWLEKQRENGAA